MQDLMTIEEIRVGLQDRIAFVVADRTGLSRHTIDAVKTGKATSINKTTRRLLSEYLTTGKVEVRK